MDLFQTVKLVLFRLTLVVIEFSTSSRAEFYYKNMSEYKPLYISSSCLKHVLDEDLKLSNYQLSCSAYQLKNVSIQTEGLSLNVLRVIGEYDTIRIICSAERPLDFKYEGFN